MNIFQDSSFLVVISFLIITLILGLYSGRNIKDFRDYAVGGKRFTTFALVLSFLASNIGGGSIIGMINSTYKIGVIGTVASLGFFIQYFLFAKILGPSIVKFKNCITIGDLFEKLYNSKIKLVCGILTFLSMIFKGASQLLAIGLLSKSLLGIDQKICIVSIGFILSVYTVHGGIKSVVATDILQFIVFFIFFPLLASYMVYQVGGYKTLFNSLPNDCFKIFDHSQFYKYISLFVIFSFFPMSLLNPADMLRVFMSKNKFQVKFQFINVSFLYPLFKIIIMLIGLCCIVLYPQANGDTLISTLFFNSSNFFQILLMISLFAAIMSSADSFFHAGGIVIYNDIIKFFKKKNQNNNELFEVRLCSFLVSIGSILIAINSKNILNLHIIAAKITGPGLLIPLIFGIIGVKSDFRSFFWGFLMGILSFFVLEKYLVSKFMYVSLPLSIVINGIFFLISHIILNKGIAFINRDYDEQKEQSILKLSWQNGFDRILSLVPTLHNIFEFFRKSYAKCGANNILFGVFACINFIVPYFMWDHQNKEYYNLMIYIRFFGALLGGLIIVRSEWKDFLKPYFPLFWYFTLLYCLPFISTVMFLLTKGSMIWLLNIGMSIFFLIILSENKIFLTLSPIGIFLGIIFYKLKIGPIQISSFDFETNYYLLYQLIFSSIIGLIFSYKRRIFETIKGNEGINLGLALTHELRNTGMYIYPASQINLKYLQKSKVKHTLKDNEKGYFFKEKDFEAIHQQNQEIEKLSKLQKNIIRTFEKLLKEYRDSINDPKIFSIRYIVKNAIKQYIFEPNQKQKLEVDLENDFIAKVPKEVFIFVIDNIIRNAFEHANPTKIKIWLKQNKLHIKDNGKGITENELNSIFKMYFTQGNSSKSGIGLAFAKQIVEGFGGEIEVESKTGDKSYTEFVIKFPKITEQIFEE